MYVSSLNVFLFYALLISEQNKVAFKVYDMDRDGYISNGELFNVLKMMVGNNLKDTQLQQIVDKTIINADKDGDGKISYEGNLIYHVFVSMDLETRQFEPVFVGMILAFYVSNNAFSVSFDLSSFWTRSCPRIHNIAL